MCERECNDGFSPADSDDEGEDIPDITPGPKKGKRKSSEELAFSGSIGSCLLLLVGVF